jgi:hypothetical protein
MITDCGAVGRIRIGTFTRKRNPPQRHNVHHKSHIIRPWIEPGSPQRLSYGKTNKLLPIEIIIKQKANVEQNITVMNFWNTLIVRSIVESGSQ